LTTSAVRRRAVRKLGSDAPVWYDGVGRYPLGRLARPRALDDSARNHIREEIVSLTPLGNRARVRLRTLTAEITMASATRLDRSEERG
jgi:hypothetical protein